MVVLIHDKLLIQYLLRDALRFWLAGHFLILKLVNDAKKVPLFDFIADILDNECVRLCPHKNALFSDMFVGNRPRNSKL